MLRFEQGPGNALFSVASSNIDTVNVRRHEVRARDRRFDCVTSPVRQSHGTYAKGAPIALGTRRTGSYRFLVPRSKIGLNEDESCRRAS